MPEIKNTFTQGKMNKDLDERIIPNGQYKDALNVKVNSSDDASVGTVQNILGNFPQDTNGIVPSDYLCIATIADEKTNKLYWFVTKELIPIHAILQYDPSAADGEKVKIVLLDKNELNGRGALNFTTKIITGINIIDNLLFWTDGVSEPKKINIDDCISGSVTQNLDTAPQTVLVGTQIPIEEEHITVIKKSPRVAPQTTLLPNYDSSSILFEKVFPRFSYRYKYKDGEYSSFGPFTDVIFNPIYKESYNANNFYSVQEGNNTGMLNNIQAIQFDSFNYENLPEEVVQVELLYKEEGSTVVFSVKKINNDDPEWTNNRFVIDSEEIFAAIPSNQLLRPWDNVPKKAVAQEVTGNRVVYGNYTQGADLIDSSGSKSTSRVIADYEKRDLRYTLNNDYSLGGIASLKSQREYSVGLVWGDKYGRETPVLENIGSVTLPWFNQGMEGGLLASNSTSLKLSINGSKPHWADYYKFFVKENSGEYYNLLMERAYFYTPATNYFDKNEEKIWLGFVSSDRNKLSEQEYIILKKELGTNETQIPLENKFKILDIQNEAPDAIKYRYANMGRANQDSVGSDFLNVLFPETEFRPNVDGTETLHIDRSKWVDEVGAGSLQQKADNAEMWVENLYVSWKDIITNKNSERYRIISSITNNANPVSYMLKLDRKISAEDAALAKGGASGNDMADDLEFSITKREEQELEEFTGKFFVQISSISAVQEEVTDAELEANHMEVATQTSFWFYDGVSDNSFGTYLTAPNPAPDPASDLSGVSGVASTPADFTALQAKFGNVSKGFFIDSLKMVGGQIHDANYAKSTGRTWVGREDHHAVTPKWGPLLTSASAQYTTANDEDFGWGWGSFNGANPGSNPNYNSPDFGKKYPLVDILQGGVNPINSNWQQGQILRENVGTTTDETKRVNSVEGFVTTNNSTSSNASNNEAFRRWRGPGFTNLFGNYFDGGVEKTYGEENGVQYVHVSFLAPGEDLVGTISSALQATAENFGEGSPGNYIQAIWGGGIFNDPINGNTVEMEGNYNVTGEPEQNEPSPGFGYGYDDSGDLRKKHNNQWKPSYGVNSDEGKKINDFIKVLAKGSKFKFSSNDDEIFTIEANPIIKKVYNHTSWNRDYEWDGSSFVEVDSVEKAALTWANDKTQNNLDLFKAKIVDFGRASNRRLVYIFPINKNPLSLINVNDTSQDEFDAEASLNIEFITADGSAVLDRIMKGSAVWETEPKKEDEVSIYYEASQAYPTKLTDQTNVDFAPPGSYIEFVDLPEAKNGKHIIEKRITLMGWDSFNRFRLAEYKTIGGVKGFNKYYDNNDTPIDYVGALVRFYRKDGGYTTGRISGVQSAANETFTDIDPVTGNIQTYSASSDFYNKFYLEEDIDTNLEVGLNYFNCFTFGNGIESNRIRDDFNSPTIRNGVKASIILETDYKEENRNSGLIFSGIYNSNSGVNNLNQFIMAENITKDLNPTYGSIQKLFQRRISLVALCEDRIVSITSNKDALFNADGNSQLVSTNAVLGDATPFVGDFGISKNPESFAKESYRAYFADKQRGAVLRLSMDGITDISEAGMDDYFRDNLKSAGQIVGSYDAHSKDFNITLRSKLASDNFISNAFLDNGLSGNLDVPAESQQLILNNPVTNNSVLVEPRLTLTVNQGNSELDNRYLNFKTNITNHPEVLEGSIAPETYSYTTTQDSTLTFTTATITLMQMPFTRSDKGDPFRTGVGNGYGGNDKKYTALRNYTSQFSLANEAGGVGGQSINWPTPGFYTSFYGSNSGDWYTGFAGVLIGASADIFWNPIKDGYNQQTPPNDESPFGTASTHRNPWFNTTSSPNSGHGIAFDRTSSTQELILPGTKKTTVDVTTPTPVLIKYPSAVPTTIFNGEEIRIIINARGMSYNVAGQEYGSGTSNPSGTSSDHHRYLTIQLYDGTTALTDSVIMDPNGSIPSGISPSYAAYQYVPAPITSQGTTGECYIGFQTTSGVDFPPLEHNTSRDHDVSFKFTNGVDESEAIIVQDLQVHIKFVDDDGNEPDALYGSIQSFTIQKRHYMSDVDTFTTTSSPNGDQVPGEDIPAFAEVQKIGFTYWMLQDEFSNIDEYLHAPRSVDKFGDDYTAVTMPYLQTYVDVNGVTQTNSGTYIMPPDPSGTNGVVAFNDYADGSEYENDKFIIDSTGAPYYLSISKTTITGNWYAIALMRAYTAESGTLSPQSHNSGSPPPSGDAPILEHFNVPFVLTSVPYEFEEGNALHPAYLCIFEGDDTISEIKIKLPGNADLEFETINMIDISATWSGGTASHWTPNLSSAGNPLPQHAYDLPQVYASDSDGIVFNVPGPSTYTSMRQTINNLLPIPGGYLLTFSAVITSGALNFRVLGNDYNGQYGQDVIDRTGNYRIYFNMDGGNYDVEIDEGSGYFVRHQTGPATPGNANNLILFHDGSGCQGSIDNIYLTNAQDIYSGGSADHFTFSGPTGWNPTLDPFIVFNNNRIEFNNCPGVQPTSPISFYQLQQEIDPVLHPTSAGEKYKVRFQYDFDPNNGNSGGVNGYYYDGATGDGFVIGDVGGITGQGTHNAIYTIGDQTNPDPSVYLSNTLVIYSNSGQGVTNGFIDNILFRQEFTTGQEETISFSESVRGWTSRKSFVPEQGVSLSSSYFTFNTGQIYEHNIETYPDATNPAITHDQPRNNFYGVQYKSTITAILNTEPSTVKSFNTLSYEGSQSKVNQFTDTIIDGNNYNTLNNHNIINKDGWSVEHIKTDKQEGNIVEFLEKEGKWFNYIKGSETYDNDGVLKIKTSDLNIQGLGTINNITP